MKAGSGGAAAPGAPRGAGAGGGGGSGGGALKAARMATRQSKLYENCMLLDPDGAQLCNVKRERVDWSPPTPCAFLSAIPIRAESVFTQLTILPPPARRAGTFLAGSRSFSTEPRARCSLRRPPASQQTPPRRPTRGTAARARARAR